MEPIPPFSDEAKALQPGIYEHYKGGRYRVHGVARHSETLEEMVMYEALYGEGGFWLRPLKMFLETVQTPDGARPRFRLKMW